MLIPSAYTLQYHPEQCNRKAEYGCTNWNANTVREILSRQEYLGHTVLRKTIGTNFKTDERRFATDEERLVFEDTHEPIVDGELWERAYRSLKHATRRMKERTKRNVYCQVLCIALIVAVRCLIRRITTKAENPITRFDAAATGTEP